MIVAFLLALAVRRARKTWQINELTRYRWRRRGELGYELYHRVKELRREWIWRPAHDARPTTWDDVEPERVS